MILTLDEIHQYRLDDKSIDGLTSTIQEAGLIRNGDPWYMTRGTAIHLATEYFDKCVWSHLKRVLSWGEGKDMREGLIVAPGTVKEAFWSAWGPF